MPLARFLNGPLNVESFLHMQITSRDANW